MRVTGVQAKRLAPANIPARLRQIKKSRTIPAIIEMQRLLH
jgi:hypothetical protein